MEHGLLSRAAEFIERKRKKQRWQKAVTVMAAAVVFCTTYALILPAITMETATFCGQEEHTHDASCYSRSLTYDHSEAEPHVHTEDCYQIDKILICEQEESPGHTHTEACQTAETQLACSGTEAGYENGSEYCAAEVSYGCGLVESSGHIHDESCWQETKTLICTQSEDPTAEGHVHTEACYGREELTCSLEEHLHSDACYADPNADRETAAQWERTLGDVVLTGAYSTDLLAIAETQLGYRESAVNYIVNEEGRKLGYSRYGAWYGDPYGDWCAMFVSFCLHYANISEEEFPREAGCQRWIEDLENKGLYRDAAEYIPKPGDLIFFNWDEAPDSDHVGLVSELLVDQDGQLYELKTIEGNASNQVKTVNYSLLDTAIMGYGELPEGEVDEELLSTPASAVQSVLTLSQEEQSRVDEVIVLIDALPDVSVAEETLMAYETVQDWVGYEAYFREVGQAGRLAYEAYEELTPEGKDRVTNYSRLQDLEWIWSMVTLEMTDTGLEPGTYGKYTFAFNETTDAFIRDPAYRNYYNKNSPLGTAGSFHLVAFGTANLGTHTNGNVLAQTLEAGSNFGTNNYPNELSYAVNYERINAGSASGTTDHILVVGSGNTLTLGGNKDVIHINESKIDRPYQILQDLDSEENPFIDLARVEREILGISKQLGTFEDMDLTWNFSDQNNRWIQLNDPDGVGVLNLTAAELQQLQSNPLRLRGFQSGHSGTIVINVDCSGVSRLSMPQSATIFVDGQEQGTNEVVEFSSGKVVWNFRNAQGCTIEAQRMTGMILALGATVNINQNLNGTVVAENINVRAESHRTDFTGSIVPKVDREDTYIQLVKVDMENISERLPYARFSLFRWDTSAGDYLLVTSDLVTDAEGRVEIGELQYNTAYRLVETTAPYGYLLEDEPYDFLVAHTNTGTYPIVKPAGFSGDTVSSGYVKYFHNEKKEEGGYILPETGGAGSQWYILGGILLLMGGTLWYKRENSGKGGTRTS